MTTAVLDAVTAIVKYSVTDEQIADTRAKYSALSADTPDGYEEVRLAIGFVRDTRVAIEKRRVELKADALDYGRRVDAEAKRLTVLLESIEAPLKTKKAAVDDEKARIKAEQEAEKLRALEAEIAANRERQEAELRAAREAEDARLAFERARLDAERQQLAEERRIADEAARKAREAEEARLATERAALAEERRQADAARLAEQERARIEREAIETERRQVAAERERAERAEFERQAKLKAEADARAKVEAEQIAAAQRDALIASLQPDAKKLDAYAAALLAVQAPSVKTRHAKAALEAVTADLQRLAERLTALDRRVA